VMATRHINRSAVRKAMIHDIAIEILEEIYAGISDGSIENYPKFSMRLGQDPQVPRHAGLMDVHPLDDVAHGAFPMPHRLDDAQAGRVSQGLEKV